MRAAKLLVSVVGALLALATPALATPALQIAFHNDAENEVQEVHVKAESGQFKLSFGGETTADLAEDASAAQVQAALNALPAIAAGGGSVSVSGGPGAFAEIPSNYWIAFDGGPLAGTDVEQLRVIDGTVPLASYSRATITRTLNQPGLSRSDDRIDYLLDVKNAGPDPTSGEVTATLTLPPGAENKIFDTTGTGWSCTPQAPAGAQPGKAVCKRSDALAASASYPTLTVGAVLGADAPNLAVAEASAEGGGSALASVTSPVAIAPPDPFETSSFWAGVPDLAGNDFTQAGGHPYAADASIEFRLKRAAGHPQFFFDRYAAIEAPRNVFVDAPRGFVGNALAVPELCPGLDEVKAGTCPAGSAVGGIALKLRGLGWFPRIAVYAIEPEFGVPAQFAFMVLPAERNTYTFVPKLRAEDGYAIGFESAPVPSDFTLEYADVRLCDFGAKTVVLSPNEFGPMLERCKTPSDPNVNPIALITNPTRCSGTPPTATIHVDSWQNPGDFKSREFVNPMPEGCELVPFEPKSTLKPTNERADTPTGVNVEIEMPTEGVEGKDSEGNFDPDAISQAMLHTATVTFPKGMSLNPAAADGLGACTPAQVKLGSNEEHRCPESSKVGTIEIETPVIQETLTGNVFVATQGDNPFKSTLGLYMIFSSKKDGITVKIAGRLERDPVTGQLTSIFTENPEWPFSRLALKFNSGPRAPLINPPKCGTYAIHAEFSPWSAASPANPTPDEIVAQDSTFEVTEGPNGGLCPAGNLEPKLNAGLTNPVAGAPSPFVLRLSREDGTQRFTALGVKMPKGLVASLKGVPYCPDHVLAGISVAEMTGRAELDSPACPAASQVGTVSAGAGAGSFPFYAPGRAYLAGPYKGAPLSLAVVTPAVAGPYDLGNVVVRNALNVDPVTAEVNVVSDPIPTIQHGILLNVRDIRVDIDRPSFTQAPTDCEPMAIEAKVSGEGGGSATVSNRFQVDGCGALGFKPALHMRLFGGTKRGAHPKFRAVLKPRAGDANIARASVALPRSAFLDQAHIRTICTRVQFAARECPAAAIYGKAEATTSLLDNPLTGSVYLRSSDNLLPDLVAVLRGPDHQPIEVNAVGRVDSIRGGIRTTFDVVPDAPVTSFVLTMQGGEKGLLVNSRNLCSKDSRATAKFAAHNGRAVTLKPKLQNSCKAPARKKKRRTKHGR